jgi:hypothetical protein
MIKLKKIQLKKQLKLTLMNSLNPLHELWDPENLIKIKPKKYKIF